MPLIVLTDSSILSETSVSISSGAAPTKRRVVMVTNGKSMLANNGRARRYEEPDDDEGQDDDGGQDGPLDAGSASSVHLGPSPLAAGRSSSTRAKSPVRRRPSRFGKSALDGERPARGVEGGDDNRDGAVERLSRVRIDRGVHLRAPLGGAEESLGDPEAEPQGRRLDDDERHRPLAQPLADVGPSLEDDAVDRGPEDGVGEALLREVEAGLCAEAGRLRPFEGGLRALEGRLRDRLLRDELLLPREVAFGVGEKGGRAGRFRASARATSILG